MSDDYKTRQALDNLHKVDEKINTMRSKIKNDPDDAFDKLLKLALPALTGLVVGKLTSLLWKQGKRKVLGSKVDLAETDIDTDGILASMLFAALSAAIGSLTSSLSDRGSQKIVDIRHKRQSARQGKHRRP